MAPDTAKGGLYLETVLIKLLPSCSTPTWRKHWRNSTTVQTKKHITVTQFDLGRIVKMSAPIKSPYTWFPLISRFLRFLTELREEDFTTPGPNPLDNLPGPPPKWVQKLILDLILAIKHLQSQGFSARLLHLQKSYVWCEDGVLRLFGVDEKRESFDPEAWLCRLEVDISRFKVILKDAILVCPPGVSWPQRVAFLRGFDSAYNSKGSNIPPSVRLEMISSDPFLSSSRNAMFKIWRILSGP